MELFPAAYQSGMNFQETLSIWDENREYQSGAETISLIL
jgi:hypothetical protein